MLHLTNGDIVAAALRESELPGAALSWVDVLHDGPVPAGLSHSELSEVRVRFLVDASWAEADVALRPAPAHPDPRLAGRPRSNCRLSLVDYAGYLGHLAPLELVALFPERTPVTAAQLQLARRAWVAFRSPDPTVTAELVGSDTASLPHLAAALHRHLEEFPDVEAGLSRTERQILEAAAGAPRTRQELFQAHQDRESRLFMGDWSFWAHVDRLVEGPSLSSRRPWTASSSRRRAMTSSADARTTSG